MRSMRTLLRKAVPALLLVAGACGGSTTPTTHMATYTLRFHQDSADVLGDTTWKTQPCAPSYCHHMEANAVDFTGTLKLVGDTARLNFSSRPDVIEAFAVRFDSAAHYFGSGNCFSVTLRVTSAGTGFRGTYDETSPSCHGFRAVGSVSGEPQ